MDVAVTAKIPVDLKLLLRERARREDRSESSVTRQALAAFLREQ